MKTESYAEILKKTAQKNKVSKNLLHIISLFIVFGVSACTSYKPVRQSNTKHSIESTTVVRDTIIKIEQSNSDLKLALEALKEAKKPIVKQTGQSTIKLQLLRDTIFADCQCDSIQIAAQLLDRYVKERIQQETTITQFKRIPITQRIGALVIGLFILVVVGLLVTILIKILK